MKRLFVALLVVAMLAGAVHAGAQSGIEVQGSTAQIEFPNGIIFTLDASSGAAFDNVRLNYHVAPDGVQTSARPDCTGTTTLHCTFRLGASQRDLLIPGAEVTYSWTLPSGGTTLETESQQTTYEDTRFQWSTVSEGNLTVWYYDNEDDARAVLAAARGSLDNISALLQMTVDIPVKVRYYVTADDMQPAIIEDNDQGVITLGEVVYSDTAMVSGDSSAQDIARHEVAHIVVRQAIGDAFSVPDWLNEGTAVYAQSEPLEGQRRAVEQAIENGDVISVRSLSSASSGASADKVFLFYGESWSLVKFLIDTYGQEKFAQLFQVYREGASDDQALVQVYGFNQDGLENLWRESVGLPPRTPVADASPTPRPTVDDTGSAADDSGGASIGLIVAIAVVTVVVAGGLVLLAIVLARRGR